MSVQQASLSDRALYTNLQCNALNAVDEVLEVARAERLRLDAEHKGHGVHQVRLAGAIGTDNGGEVLEGANDLRGDRVSERRMMREVG